MKNVERKIKRGQRFMAASYGMAEIWVVSRRVKTEKQNFIWAICPATRQWKRYYGRQFGFLVRTGLIQLIEENNIKEAA